MIRLGWMPCLSTLHARRLWLMIQPSETRVECRLCCDHFRRPTDRPWPQVAAVNAPTVRQRRVLCREFDLCNPLIGKCNPPKAAWHAANPCPNAMPCHIGSSE